MSNVISLLHRMLVVLIALSLVPCNTHLNSAFADDVASTKPAPPDRGPEAADDYQISGNETLHIAILTEANPQTESYVSVAGDGTITASTIGPVKVIGLNARQTLQALQSAAPANGSIQIVYVDIYLTADTAPLGSSQPVPDDHKIAPGDLLEISIGNLFGEGTGDCKRTKRVSSDGSVSLPFIAPLNLSGMTAAEISAAVNKAYANARLIQNSPVTTKLLEAGK